MTRSTTWGLAGRVVLAGVLFAGLYVARLHSYLLFHSLVELFAVVVAVALFMLAWNSRHIAGDDFLLWVGIGYLFVGTLDLVHTLAYSGMGALGDLGVNPATQLWVASRSMEALTLLLAPLMFNRRLHAPATIAGFGAVTALVLLSVFAWGTFPDAYDEAARHLTLFKVMAEYVIVALLVVACGWMLAWRERMNPSMLNLLVGAIAITIIAEMNFTLYTDPYGPANMIGHFLKVVSFYLIYRAVVVIGLREPYESLFRDLKQREAELQQSQEQLSALNESLEARVIERTEQLRELARELAETENREREKMATILHDEIQQALAAARMHMQLASRKDPPEAAELLEKADDILQEAIEIARCLAVEVSPQVVRERGLIDALKWLGEHMRERHGLSVEVVASEDVCADDHELNAMLFGIVRELLFNTVKHARVGEAKVHARCGPAGEMLISVSDAGSGFDPDAIADKGSKVFGLASVCGRMEILGGECNIDSAPGEGTRIELVLPAVED